MCISVRAFTGTGLKSLRFAGDIGSTSASPTLAWHKSANSVLPGLSRQSGEDVEMTFGLLTTLKEIPSAQVE